MLLIGRVAIAMPSVLSVTMGIASHCLSQQDSKAHPTGINYILLFFFLFSIVKSNMKKIMFISFFSCVLF